MILRPEPLFGAVEWIRDRYPVTGDRVILLSPQGRKLSHPVAKELAELSRIILLCGRYEGVDERVRRDLADEELSVGDVVLTGGELPAMMPSRNPSIPGLQPRAPTDSRSVSTATVRILLSCQATKSGSRAPLAPSLFRTL